MAAVVDANLLVALATRSPRRAAVAARFAEWDRLGETLHAPVLMPYEVASALTQVIVPGSTDGPAVESVWSAIQRMPVTMHSLADVPSVVQLAHRLGRRSAYDAAYIALAEQLDAELWTLDGPLARNAAGHGLPVRLVDA